MKRIVSPGSFVSALLMVITIGSVQFVRGQEAITSTPKLSILNGRVLDRNGSVVVGSEVWLIRDKVARLVAVTNDEGIYRVDLPAGFYDLQIRANGFSTVSLKCYQVPSDGRVNLDVTLQVRDEAGCECGHGTDSKPCAKKRKTIIID